jgi:hypothetical protein
MKTIVIKTQEELDLLPLKFDEYTVIEIRSTSNICVKQARENSRVEARGNSRVEAWGNSRVIARENSRVIARENSSVEAWGNSRVEARGNSRVIAWENSRVKAFLCATVFVFSIYVTVKKLLDNSHLVYKKADCKRPEQVDSSAKITKFKDLITPTFEQWLERGYVVADGITQKLVSKKTIGEVTIFETTDFFEKEKAYAAKLGNKFAHGKTIEEAKNDLRYKLSDRDTLEYKSWDIVDQKPIDEMIEAYMAITGACSFGTRQFCESHVLKSEYSPKDIIELTKNKYGNEAFTAFWN